MHWIVDLFLVLLPPNYRVVETNVPLCSSAGKSNQNLINQLCRQHGGVLHTSVLSDVSFNPVLPSNAGFILSVSYGPILFHFYSILDEVSSRGLVWKLHIAL